MKLDRSRRQKVASLGIYIRLIPLARRLSAALFCVLRAYYVLFESVMTFRRKKTALPFVLVLHRIQKGTKGAATKHKAHEFNSKYIKAPLRSLSMFLWLS